MTVTAGRTPLHSYEPGSAMAAEALPFEFIDAAHLVVRDSDGNLRVEGTHYLIEGDGRTASGTITAQVEVDAGVQWLIWSETPLAQELDLAASRVVPLAQYERELDRRAIIERELTRDVDRAVLVPMGEDGQELPAAADRAGMIMAFDSNGDVDASLSSEALLALIAIGDADVLTPVQAAIFSNITLSGVQSLPGYTAATNDRILVAGQSTGSQNGIWLYNSAGAWTRASDMAAAATFTRRQYVAIQSGDNAGAAALNVTSTVTVGTTALDWKQVDYRAASRVWFTDAMSGMSLQDYADKHREPLNVYTDGSNANTNTDRIQAAIDRQVPLLLPLGETWTGSNLYPLDETDIKGVSRQGSRLVKGFAEIGTSGMIQPETITDALEMVSITNLTVSCPIGSYSSGGTDYGPMIHTGDGVGWTIDVDVDYWNKWAVTLCGKGHTVPLIRGRNPEQAGGADLLHVAGQTDAARPHNIGSIMGYAGDDLFGCFPMASSALADQDILGVRVGSIVGRSYLARLAGIGIHRGILTATVANITIGQIIGRGGSADQPAIYIYNSGSSLDTPEMSTSTGVVQGISILDAIVDATDATSYIKVWGPDWHNFTNATELARAREQFRDIFVNLRSMKGTTGPVDRGVDLNGQHHNVRVIANGIDCSNVTGDVMRWISPKKSLGGYLVARGVAGAGGGFSTTTGAETIESATIEVDVEGIATNQTLCDLVGVTDSDVHVHGDIESGATGTIGINEAASCVRNNFTGNVRAFATGVDTRQPSSTYNVAGVTVPWNRKVKGADQTISADVTLSADDTLVISGMVAGVYRIRGNVWLLAANATMDYKFDLNFTGTATYNFTHLRYSAPGDTTETIAVGTSAISSTAVTGANSGVARLQFDLEMVVSASGGFQFRWAQNTSNAGNLSVLAGSEIEWALVA